MTAAELKAKLQIAARAKMQFGATGAQIDMIVRLAEEEGDFAKYDCNTITKVEASAVIDAALNPEKFRGTYKPLSEEEKASRAAAEADYADREGRKAAWIAANYPDYQNLPSKKRKKIRHAANKAIG